MRPRRPLSRCKSSTSKTKAQPDFLQDHVMADSPDTEMMPLRVEGAEEIAQGIFSFELRRPNGADLPEFTSGSHLTLRVPNGLIRKYSLCNDPAERDRYVIGVRRETEGRGGSVSLV